MDTRRSSDIGMLLDCWRLSQCSRLGSLSIMGQDEKGRHFVVLSGLFQNLPDKLEQRTRTENIVSPPTVPNRLLQFPTIPCRSPASSVVRCHSLLSSVVPRYFPPSPAVFPLFPTFSAVFCLPLRSSTIPNCPLWSYVVISRTQAEDVSSDLACCSCS